MKKLIVPSIDLLNSPLLNPIDIALWGQNIANVPKVHFNISHDNHHIHLNYFVKEHCLRAIETENNGNVWEDSCVECFVMPENDGIYYNFEFNCIGTKLLAVGNSRENRTFAPSEILDKITVVSSLEKEPFDEVKGDFDWSIAVKIPVESFFKHTITSLNNKCFRANFYKCGDKLSAPHFLVWSTIETAEPDFHAPTYFGEICFK
jgi:Carbohydrate-binding family 9